MSSEGVVANFIYLTGNFLLNQERKISEKAMFAFVE